MNRKRRGLPVSLPASRLDTIFSGGRNIVDEVFETRRRLEKFVARMPQSQPMQELFMMFGLNVLTFISTYDPPSLTAGSTTTTSFTALGIQKSSDVIIGITHTQLSGSMVMTGYISQDDQITAVLTNHGGSTLDLSSGEIIAVVLTLPL